MLKKKVNSGFACCIKFIIGWKINLILNDDGLKFEATQ